MRMFNKIMCLSSCVEQATCSCMTFTHCNWLQIRYFIKSRLEYTVLESLRKQTTAGHGK